VRCLARELALLAQLEEVTGLLARASAASPELVSARESCTEFEHRDSYNLMRGAALGVAWRRDVDRPSGGCR
jgi:hypothetical protein